MQLYLVLFGQYTRLLLAQDERGRTQCIHFPGISSYNHFSSFLLVQWNPGHSSFKGKRKLVGELGDKITIKFEQDHKENRLWFGSSGVSRIGFPL